MELWKYYRKIYRRKWWIVIGMAICLLFPVMQFFGIKPLGISIFAQNPKFKAQSRVMERAPSYTGVNVFNNPFYGLDPQFQLINMARIAQSDAVLDNWFRTLLSPETSYQFAQGRESETVRERLIRQYGNDAFNEVFLKQQLAKQLKIEPERDTMALSISFTAEALPESVSNLTEEQNKNLAQAKAVGFAQMATDLAVKAFQEEYKRIIYNPEKQSDYINQQVEAARLRVEETRKALEDYKSKNRIAGQTLTNLEADVQVRLARLSELEAQSRTADVLAREARQRRVESEQAIRSIPEYRQEQETTSENQLWIQLTSQLNQAEQELAGHLATRGPNHPEVKRLQESIDDIKARVSEENRRIKVSQVEAANPVHTTLLSQSIQSRIEDVAATAKANALKPVVAQMKSELNNVPQFESEIAKRTLEADVAAQTFTLLRQKQEEAKFRENDPYLTGEIRRLDSEVGEVPWQPVPTYNMQKVALLLPLSILLSMMLILVLDYLDNSIRTPEEAEELLALPVAAMIPIGKGHSLVRGLPEPGLRETYQMLSSALWYKKVRESGGGALLVASAAPKAGRTVTAGNLAAALATDGARVILVDADFRQPAQHLVFGLDNSKGLSNILAGGAAIENVAVPTKIEGLLLITSGPIPENPVRLLRSEEMAAFLDDALSVADFVIFDSPAGSPFADAVVMASQIGQVLLVQSAGRVPRGAEREFRNRLEQVGVDFVGVVLNKVKPEDSHGVYHFRTGYPGLSASSGRGKSGGSVPPTSPAIPGS